MTHKEIFYLIGKCLSLNEQSLNEKQALRTKIENGEIDWKLFVKVASDHLVLPAIYISLKNNNLLDILPSALSEHLANIYK
jgi:hypothetical protein